MPEPIFSKIFLTEYLADFRLASIVNLNKKRDIIQNWIDSAATGKLNYFKEEEVKSRFIMEFFGEVLGFNYKNPGIWLCREEVKTKADATKPDAALGIFRTTSKNISNEVYAIVEIKDFGTDIDADQNRSGMNLSPVEQAFLYAPKMGGQCRWVVVSSFKETRFYHYSDITVYQPYQLVDLLDEEVLKELLFLFSKDQWINQLGSVTDKLYLQRKRQIDITDHSQHIIDQLYFCLWKFEGLEFIDPNYVANLKPFNVLDDYVWHFYPNTLYTINPEIFGLLQGITYNENELILSDVLETSLKKGRVTDHLYKLRYIFERLHQFLIREIHAVNIPDIVALKNNAEMANKYRHYINIISKDHLNFKVFSREPQECDCINCNYRSLNFKHLIGKAKKARFNHLLTNKELAYAHYLLSSDNFKESYFIYKNAESETKGIETKNVEYFLVKINLSHLYNLVSTFSEGNKEILEDIKAIDLDRSIHNELDIYVDEDVRKYLIHIKEFQLFSKVEKRINELVDKIRKLKELLNKGGHYSGTDHLEELNHQYHLLYSHFHKNYLIYDAFSDFIKAVTTLFEGLVLSYQTKNFGLVRFNEFYLIEAVLYVPRKKLIELLNDCSSLPILPEEQERFLEKGLNLLSVYETAPFVSYINKDIEAQLINRDFREKYANWVSNLFTIMSKMELTEKQASRFVNPIVNFISVEDFLDPYHLAQLGIYLEKFGFVFKRHQVIDLLSFMIGKTKYGYTKYTSIINSLTVLYPIISPEKPLTEVTIIRRAVENEKDDHGHFQLHDLLGLFQILDESGKDYFREEVTVYLDKNFDSHLYLDILHAQVLVRENGDFFERYIAYLKKIDLTIDPPLSENEQCDWRVLTLVNLIFLCYRFDLIEKATELNELTNLSLFGQWALHPTTFDYTRFDARWLTRINQPYILKILAPIEPVRECLKNYLEATFNEELSAIFFVLCREASK